MEGAGRGGGRGVAHGNQGRADLQGGVALLRGHRGQGKGHGVPVGPGASAM